MTHKHYCEAAMIIIVLILVACNVMEIDSRLYDVVELDELLTLNATYSAYAERLYHSSGACNIDIISWRDMSAALFYSAYYEGKPFIVDYEENRIRNSRLRHLCRIDRLLWHFGEHEVTLSSSNTHSYAKRQTQFADYVRHHYDDVFYNLNPHRPANETWYFFGDNDWTQQDWKRLIMDNYDLPRFANDSDDIAIAFGLGGVGSGVPMHFHGHGFSEVMYGEKRWFLFPPDIKPDFDPNMTTFYWFMTEYPRLRQAQHNLFECVIRPGQVLYFPSQWYHATLNYAKTIFVTAFI